jgi:putative drug exporter of the RND superfamily
MRFIDGILKRLTGKRGRWVTLIIWLIMTAVLSMTLPNVNSVEDNSSSLLPNSVMSAQAQKITKKEFPNNAGMPLLIVWQRDGGLKENDFNAVQDFYKSLEKKPVKEMGDMPPFAQMPIQAFKKSLSKDGEALITPVFIKNGADHDVLKSDVQQIKAEIGHLVGKEAFQKDLNKSGLHVRLSGPVGIQVDAVSLFSKADFTLLFSTILLVLLLLIVLYRSPLLAIVPLIGVGFAYGIASPILGALAKGGIITVDSQAVSIMTVLLFGAGTDYCLFLVSKYREYLLYEENKYEALRAALKHSGGAIMMSALTVVLGLLTLLLAHFGSYIHFAVPFSLAVLIMGLVALTFLPAVLAIFGRASFWPFIPRTKEMTKDLSNKKSKPVKMRVTHGRVSTWLGHFVTQRPWAIIITTVVILGGLSLFAPNIRYSYGLLDSFPKDMPSREGYNLIAKHFSAGDLAPVQVIVDTEGKKLDIAHKLSGLDYVANVSEGRLGKFHKNLVSYNVTLNQNPYTPGSIQLIPDIKKTVRSTLKESGVTVKDHYWIGGQTSELYDTEQVTNRDEHIIVPVVIVIIALLLLLYLRSVVAMVYLMLTVLLSYFSALGLGWFVLHDLMGASALQGLIPLYAFVFLVALGEDYNIFMISSIWKHRRNMSLKEAISKGVTETSSVITSCGLILAGTFAVLATLPIQVLLQFGIVTAIGVLLDTFIVRPLLVPAITTVIGRFAFWPGRYWRVKD